MLKHWFRRPPPELGLPGVPEGRGVYAIGDIHGRLDLMSQLLEQVKQDADRHPADLERCLVFLGDYIDRGPESWGVIEFLRSRPLSGFTNFFLLGNHEEAMLDFLDGRSDGLGWLTYGGLETLVSYDVPLRALPTDPATSEALREALRTALPAEHVEFMRGCVLSHHEGDYVFVHAGVRPGRPMAMQQRQDLLWIRDDFLDASSPLPGKVVVHGHTICDVPQDLGYRIDIDTGAFVSGRLTCLVLRDHSRRFLATGGRRATPF
jgi:serine/threonine protein phosphatase 1